jgi:putative nucleotidyltransferase with HDIG domain
MIDSDEMVSVLDKTEDLPTLPTVYKKVSDLINDPKSSVTDVSKVIEVDQSLTGKILKLVNSSFFGFSRKISSIHQAVVLMGFNTIKNTVLSVSVFDGFGEQTNGTFDLKQFWKHAIACGSIASILEKNLKTGFSDEVFVAGLLHDMGKIILNRHFEEEFNLTVEYAQKNHQAFYDCERAIVGFSHDEVGEYLADKWQLPFILVEAISLHHQPDNIRSNPKLVSLIHLADTLTYPMNYGFLNQFKKNNFNPFIMDELNLNKSLLFELVNEVKKTIKEEEDLFSILG